MIVFIIILRVLLFGIFISIATFHELVLVLQSFESFKFLRGVIVANELAIAGNCLAFSDDNLRTRAINQRVVESVVCWDT